MIPTTIYRHADGRLRYRAVLVVEELRRFDYSLAAPIRVEVDLVFPVRSVEIPYAAPRGLRHIVCHRTREVTPGGRRVFRA